MVFAGTLSADRALRDAAEAHLHLISNDPTLPHHLMLFAASCHTDAQHAACGGASLPSVKLAAAVRLRNVIARSNWNRVPYFTVAVKQQIKSEIVEVSCGPHVEEPVRRQIGAVMEAIVGYDYPSSWPELLPQLQRSIGGAVQGLSLGRMEASISLSAALHALRCCCKRHEDVTEFSDSEIDGFADVFCLPLLELGQQLLGATASSDANVYYSPSAARRRDSTNELFHCTRLVWKCFWSITASRWPLCLCRDSAANDAFHLVLRSLTIAIDALYGSSLTPRSLLSSGVDGTAQAFSSVPSWRTLKWTLKMAHRWVAHMGVAPKTVERRARSAAKVLSDSFVVPLSSCALRLLQWHQGSEGSAVTSKAGIVAMEIVELVLSHQGAYEAVVAPAAPQLIGTCLFPRLTFHSDDAELWACNPEEYVRRQTDPRGDLYNPKLVAMSLIAALCKPSKSFHSSTLLSGFLQFLLGRLKEALEELQGGDVTSAAPVLDGCLYAVTQMKKVLEGSPELLSDSAVEWMLSTYVAPLLSCEVGYLRARAVFTLSLFTDTEWSRPDVFPTILNAVLPLLEDNELPVRIQTCVCLSRLIRKEAAREVVTPRVGHIIQQYFYIMRQMDNDGVVRTLRKTIKFYGATLSQWALELCQMLVQHFMGLHEQLLTKNKNLEEQNGGEADGDDDVVDSLLAADELVETLRTLVMAIPNGDGHAETMHRLQQVIAPMLLVILSPQKASMLGFMDRCLHLLTTLLSRSEGALLSDCMWPLMGCLYHIAADGSFMDYVEQLVAPMDNFVSVDAVGYFTRMVAVDNEQAATSAQLTTAVCSKVLQCGSSLHHFAAVPPMIDTMLLHGWNAGSVLGELTTAVVECTRMCLGVLAQRSSEFPPTLQVLFANSVLVGLIAEPRSALSVLIESRAEAFVLSAICDLFLSTPVKGHLRNYDRIVFVVAVERLLYLAASSDDAVSATALSLAASVLSSPSGLVAMLAEQESKLVAAEIAYHEKRLRGEKVDADDDEYDEFGDSDDDDDTIESFSDGVHDLDDGGDDCDDDQDVDDANGPSQFNALVSKARGLREEDEDDDAFDTNFLANDDFETPLDDVDVWKRLADALSSGCRVVASAHTLSSLNETSRLFATCQQLRGQHPSHHTALSTQH